MQARLLFSPGFPPSKGGLQNFMMARCLAASKGLEVIASKFEGDEAFDARQAFAIHRFAYPWLRPKMGVLRRSLQLWRSDRILREVLKQKRFDVVETATVFPGAVIAQRLRKRHDFVLVSFAAGDDILRPLSTWYSSAIIRNTLKSVDLVVAISQFSKQLLVDAGCLPERVVIINPPIDCERFGKLGDGGSVKAGLPPHDLILLTISRLVEKKSIDQIIEVMPRLLKRFPGLLYVVGGEGPDLPRLQALTIRHGVADRVVFLGLIPEEKLVDTYAACDVFVMPTRFDVARGEVEGFGISYLEASAQGRPVIGTNTGGTGDAIKEGVTGFRINPEDSEALESRLTELLGNPKLRQAMGEAGRNFALKPADWSPLLDLGSARL
jgi:phosphatidylinositol alpha-1,6-mannosyltransferase